MAFQMSTLASRVRLIAPLWRSLGDSVEPGVKFRHTFGVAQPKRQVHSLIRPAKGSAITNCNGSLYPGVTANSVVKFSTTTSLSKWFQRQLDGRGSGGIRGAVCRIALGALGVTAAAGACLSGSAPVAMAAGSDHLKLDSAKGDWKKAKDALLSMSVEERREHYRSSHVALEDVPVWTPSPSSGSPAGARFPVDPALDGKISLFSGDITKLEVDGIVNAANKTLLGGGGVDGAIHRTAGPLLRAECAELRGCETGEAKITGGYGLPAKHVIHTVGPIVLSGSVRLEDQALLRSCYRSSLETAARGHLRSLAFPCISTGVYGYPAEQAVEVALATVREYLDEHCDQLDRVIFCVFLPKDKELYENSLPLYFPGASSGASSEGWMELLGCRGYAPWLFFAGSLLLLLFLFPAPPLPAPGGAGGGS